MLIKKYAYLQEGFSSSRGIGTPNFQDGMRWCNCFIEPMTMVANMTFLDYGCGDARLANFISAHIENWIYYGLEHPKSELIAFSKQSPFFNDARCHFGLMETEFETIALNESNRVVLGSVFTHLQIDDFYVIMDKFKEIINRSGEVVFSVFIDDSYHFENHHGVYGVPNCISRVYYTKKQLEDFAKENNYELTEHESFLAQGENLHRIFKVRRKK